MCGGQTACRCASESQRRGLMPGRVPVRLGLGFTRTKRYASLWCAGTGVRLCVGEDVCPSTTVDIVRAISRGAFSPPSSRIWREELGLRDCHPYPYPCYAVSAYRCPLVAGVIFAAVAQRGGGHQQYVQDGVPERT